MSQSASQASLFYQDVAKTNKVWSIRDESGIPAPLGVNGKRSMPFWSSKSRIEKIIATIDDYKNFDIFEIDLDDFKNKWLVGLDKDGLLVGVNWSGKRATGYDVEPLQVLQNIEFQLSK